MKVVVILAIFISLLFSDAYSYLKTGWNLTKNYYTNQDFSNTNYDLIMTYQNNTWYGISPNNRFSTWLTSKNIATLPTLNSSDAL